MPLPPGLAGFVAAQEAARRGEASSLQQATGILGLQGMLEAQRQAAAMHPLQLEQMKLAMEQARRKDEALANLAGVGALAAQGALAQGAAVGDVGPTVTNAQRMGVLNQPSNQQYLDALRAGIDPKMITAMRDISVPKMEVSNNYAYDPRAVGSGFMPGLNFNREGQAALAMPGPGGIPNISAPPGAMDVYGGYKDIAERAAARYQPFEIKPTSPGQNPRVVSRLEALSPGAPAPASASPETAGPSAAWPYQNLSKGSPGVQGRTPQELAAMNSVKGGGPALAITPSGETVPAARGTPAGPGTPSGLSPEQEAQQAARAAALKGRGEAGVKYEETILDAGRNARNNLTQLQIIAPNIEKLPTGPMYPMLVNSKAYLAQMGLSVDPNLGPAQASTGLLNQFALKLRDPSAGGGMPGNLSNSDRDILFGMVPGLDKLPEGNKILMKIFTALEERKIAEAHIVNKMQSANMTTNDIRDALTQFANTHSIVKSITGK